MCVPVVCSRIGSVAVKLSFPFHRCCGISLYSIRLSVLPKKFASNGRLEVLSEFVNALRRYRVGDHNIF